MKLKRLNLIDGGEKDSERYKSLEPFDQEFIQSEMITRRLTQCAS
jgi:hypothetical protein